MYLIYINYPASLKISFNLIGCCLEVMKSLTDENDQKNYPPFYYLRIHLNDYGLKAKKFVD